MKCAVCDKEVVDESKMVILNVDGDPACSERCRETYIQQMNHFLNDIVQDDALFAEWWNL
jgi:hypothetical protein